MPFAVKTNNPTGFIERTGQFFFIWRDKLPVPLVLALVSCSRSRAVTWLLGMPLIILGEFLRLWALTHIGPKTRTRKVSAERLITSGPYSHCRNPLYLANLLKISGITLIAGNIRFAIVVMFFYLLEFSTMIPFEENFLAQQFPEEQQKYREAVPAFIPSLNPATEFAGEPAYSWREALTSEKRTFASTTLILLLIALADQMRRRAAT